MNIEDLARFAGDFNREFKEQIVRQIYELNAVGDGKLQDGFNSAFIEDGWISLKGYSWGFVVHYEDPVTIDMTFGPDAPFIGYRMTFIAKPVNGRLTWVNTQQEQMCFDVEQLARFGLRKLACKTGDEWIFDEPFAHPLADSNLMGETI